MSKKNSLFKRIHRSWKKIHLVDKCLIIFMGALLIQATYSILSKGDNNSEATNIDVIVRTSAAAIFGYFLSANFIQDCDNLEEPESEPKTKFSSSISEDKKDTKTTNQIGFKPPSSDNDMELGSAKSSPEPKHSSQNNKLQIVIATIVGLFCLTVLSVMRNIYASNPDLKATHDVMAIISQFRDFVSGCVGFLIGCPTSRRNN